MSSQLQKPVWQLRGFVFRLRLELGPHRDRSVCVFYRFSSFIFHVQLINPLRTQDFSRCVPLTTACCFSFRRFDLVLISLISLISVHQCLLPCGTNSFLHFTELHCYQCVVEIRAILRIFLRERIINSCWQRELSCVWLMLTFMQMDVCIYSTVPGSKRSQTG